MLLYNLLPSTSRAIKERNQGRHPPTQDKGVASLSGGHLNAMPPLVDPKPAGRGKAESRRNRIVARIERCRLIQHFFRRTSQKEACVSCLETMPAGELVSLPCQHKYCNTCIRQMAATSMVDEQLFPPRCCSRKIPPETILHLLPPKERESFVSKTAEYATPVTDRWYCPAPACGKWIPSMAVKAEKSQTQACPYCSTKICTGCRGISHRVGGCSSDIGLSAVLEVARLQRWQRCFNCGAVVELIFGCDHITCRCSAQFCYKCGKPWSSCICVTPAERPVDFFTFVIDGNALSRDEEAGLTAVLAAMLCHERESEEPLADKGRKGTHHCQEEGRLV
ncbi:hypothetical protein BDV26DRAFT_272572 [Aspergillus bertholletiae]|uniref:RBR-type E3 ubiquitin transferase n=1 Tax=Aspergillus bertholletiae TaxID=1226010 RepID=A0A5N7ATL6_9EURO|nr:hypothetical protein BDV26DRAFT_272572 [Aspergillus bertholletiae]